MDSTLVETIRQKFAPKSTEDLAAILRERDISQWSEEAFEAARLLLLERREPVPEYCPSSPRSPVFGDGNPILRVYEYRPRAYWWFLSGCCFLVMGVVVPILVGQEGRGAIIRINFTEVAKLNPAQHFLFMLVCGACTLLVALLLIRNAFARHSILLTARSLVIPLAMRHAYEVPYQKITRLGTDMRRGVKSLNLVIDGLGGHRIFESGFKSEAEFAELVNALRNALAPGVWQEADKP